MVRVRRLRFAVPVGAVLVAASLANPLHDAERMTLSVPTQGPAQRLAGTTSTPTRQVIAATPRGATAGTPSPAESRAAGRTR